VVSAWWMLWVFLVGGYAGLLLAALMVVARDDADDPAGTSADEEGAMPPAHEPDLDASWSS